ncbi:MAG: class I SAM-dependent methyltransferase [Gammaproteobacteria bacterium]
MVAGDCSLIAQPMSMHAQYDKIAEQYRRSKESPLRSYIEAHTFMQLIGDVSGLRVLDLACGEGFYSRRLKTAGADHVVGIDISSAMIELAQAREREELLGIEYLCADVGEIDRSDVAGPFDVVTAAYLLHYAPDEAALARMCTNIVAALPPGGRFVALNENPDQAIEQYRGYDQYGFNKSADEPLCDGAMITYWMIAGRDMFRIHAHWYSRATYERVLRAAGFVDVRWHPLQLDAAGVAEHGNDYWREYMDNPPIVGLECRT